MTDSRHYRFPYLIRSKDDIPPDFPKLPQKFDTGLFLPRDDSDWFGRSAYPPRILVLLEGGLQIHTHPSTPKQILKIPIDEYIAVESGHALLMGWLCFRGRDSGPTLEYNTRISRPIHEFLRAVRECFPHFDTPHEALSFGDPLDLKFRNALADELDKSEDLLVRLFHPAREESRGRWFLRWKRWSPADLTTLTNRRILWITDRHKGSYEMYGTVSYYAPLAGIGGVEVSTTDETENGELRVSLRTDNVWRIPFPNESKDAAIGFAAAAKALLKAAN